MRAAPLIALLAVAGAALFFSRGARASVPTGRGDYQADLEFEIYDFDFLSIDPLQYLPPVDIDPFFWNPDMSDQPIYDPRDVASRRWHPSYMQPSDALKDWLRRKEKFVGTKYELGDGGVTIGFGWFEPYSRAHLMPDTITLEDATRKFNEHVETRGAAWVREYVTTPLLQSEFDALTSLAYNLSPQSFKRIADALNAGDDWQAVALEYTRPGTNLENGLRNRRAAEFAMFESGVYA